MQRASYCLSVLIQESWRVSVSISISSELRCLPSRRSNIFLKLDHLRLEFVHSEHVWMITDQATSLVVPILPVHWRRNPLTCVQKKPSIQKITLVGHSTQFTCNHEAKCLLMAIFQEVCHWYWNVWFIYIKTKLLYCRKGGKKKKEK